MTRLVLQALLACALLATLSLAHTALVGSPKIHAQSLTALCNTTTNPTLCLSTLSSLPCSQRSALLQDLTAYVISSALSEVNRSYFLAHEIKDSDVSDILQDCLELMDDSRDELLRSAKRLSHLYGKTPPVTLGGEVMDVRVWLSTSLADLNACWDELADPKAVNLRGRLHGAGQKNVEPLLSIELTLAERLVKPGGASTSYGLACHLRHQRGSRHHPDHHRHHRHHHHHDHLHSTHHHHHHLYHFHA